MSEETLADDQSHYEVSLTAGQAFLAFVLLLLSLAASFAFGLVIGRGQVDDKFATRKEPVVTEADAVPRKAVKAEVAVDLPRPRRVYELKADPHFGELVYRVWSLVRDEVQRAKAEEEAQAP